MEKFEHGVMSAILCLVAVEKRASRSPPRSDLRLKHSTLFCAVFKILLVGDTGVGKSALLMRFTQDRSVSVRVAKGSGAASESNATVNSLEESWVAGLRTCLQQLGWISA